MTTCNSPSIWRRLVTRLTALLDDALPMSPEEREQRDTAGLDANDVAARRRLRFQLGMLEKRGKGGPR
jgi:hypothetical protein